MTLKLTRSGPGLYSTTLPNGKTYLLTKILTRWEAIEFVPGQPAGEPLATAKTKKELVSKLEVLGRTLKDRDKADSIELFRRGTIEKGRGLKITGLGECEFLGYTKTHAGKEWIDVVQLRTGRSRAVDPRTAKITVHRKK